MPDVPLDLPMEALIKGAAGTEAAELPALEDAAPEPSPSALLASISSGAAHAAALGTATQALLDGLLGRRARGAPTGIRFVLAVLADRAGRARRGAMVRLIDDAGVIDQARTTADGVVLLRYSDARIPHGERGTLEVPRADGSFHRHEFPLPSTGEHVVVAPEIDGYPADLPDAADDPYARLPDVISVALYDDLVRLAPRADDPLLREQPDLAGAHARHRGFTRTIPVERVLTDAQGTRRYVVFLRQAWRPLGHTLGGAWDGEAVAPGGVVSEEATRAHAPIPPAAPPATGVGALPDAVAAPPDALVRRSRSLASPLAARAMNLLRWRVCERYGVRSVPHEVMEVVRTPFSAQTPGGPPAFSPDDVLACRPQLAGALLEPALEPRFDTLHDAARRRDRDATPVRAIQLEVEHDAPDAGGILTLTLPPRETSFRETFDGPRLSHAWRVVAPSAGAVELRDGWLHLLGARGLPFVEGAALLPARAPFRAQLSFEFPQPAAGAGIALGERVNILPADEDELLVTFFGHERRVDGAAGAHRVLLQWDGARYTLAFDGEDLASFASDSPPEETGRDFRFGLLDETAPPRRSAHLKVGAVDVAPLGPAISEPRVLALRLPRGHARATARLTLVPPATLAEIADARLALELAGDDVIDAASTPAPPSLAELARTLRQRATDAALGEARTRVRRARLTLVAGPAQGYSVDADLPTGWGVDARAPRAEVAVPLAGPQPLAPLAQDPLVVHVNAHAAHYLGLLVQAARKTPSLRSDLRPLARLGADSALWSALLLRLEGHEALLLAPSRPDDADAQALLSEPGVATLVHQPTGVAYTEAAQGALVLRDIGAVTGSPPLLSALQGALAAPAEIAKRALDGVSIPVDTGAARKKASANVSAVASEAPL